MKTEKPESARTANEGHVKSGAIQKQFAISQPVLLRWIKEGKIPFINIGKLGGRPVYRFRLSQVEAALKGLA